MRGSSILTRRSRNAVRFAGGRRLDAERVGKADEQAEQCCHVRGLGYLLICPAHVAQALDLFVGHSICGTRDGFDEFQELVFFGSQAGGVEVTVAESFRRSFELLALQLQEPRV